MSDETVIRWDPSVGLPERPAEGFDLLWQSRDLRLIATVRYATTDGEDEDAAGAVVIFENVICFKALDEYMDGSVALTSSAAQLATAYPYGGRWPFLEVSSSGWLAELAVEHGALDLSDVRHLVITARNMHLHVAFYAGRNPAYHAAR